MRGIMRVEDRDRQIIAIDDFDGSDDERILGGKELVTALVTRRNLIENAMMDETAQDLPKGGDRGERFGPITARVDDLQAGVAGPSNKVGFRITSVVVGRAKLYEEKKEPFAFPS